MQDERAREYTTRTPALQLDRFQYEPGFTVGAGYGVGDETGDLYRPGP